ncbi:T9SS type A sorting domain-containing protein [Gillisia hiemivivida]|uniref:T9SS type A sorting domain-containing protein n=1 Tax=Gillisia hiemivivida TaxID=291190 RepID=A0A5C6ZWD5_9FLAO|nr:T9SS type A sorting domain-containing protein [Gillisia hiemivivida]TXD95165.1 T9SS type A sorting domain-containing protein [Gillisia hiemivivida]
MMKKLQRKMYVTVAFSLIGIFSLSAQTSTPHASGADKHDHGVAKGMSSPIDDSFSWHNGPQIEGGKEDITLSLSPNPTSNNINMRMSNSHIKSVVVYNLEGKKLLGVLYDVPGHAASVDVSNLKKGLLIIQMETDKGKIHTRRFFKK